MDTVVIIGHEGEVTGNDHRDISILVSQPHPAQAPGDGGIADVEDRKALVILAAAKGGHIGGVARDQAGLRREVGMTGPPGPFGQPEIEFGRGTGNGEAGKDERNQDAAVPTGTGQVFVHYVYHAPGVDRRQKLSLPGGGISSISMTSASRRIDPISRQSMRLEDC